MLLLASLAHAAPSDARDLVDALRGRLEDPAGPGCLTTMLAELDQRADELSAEDRAWVSRTLTPWKQDLRAPVQPRAEGVAPPSAPNASCFQMGENELNSEHFSVQWDGDTIDEETAQDFLDSLEDGWEAEVEELGWSEPLQASRYLLPAYVQDGNYQGAYTYVETCGASYVPYIVAYSGSFSRSAGTWGKDMAVHEFNHALQFSYGVGMEFWWWEATATYIQSQVYNSGWWLGYVSGYSGNPQIAMSASNQDDQDIFWHMYGMSIWANYMDEYIGGPDTVLETWENAERNSRGYSDYGMEDAFDDAGLDLRAAYADFVARNVVMQYDDQSRLPEVDERDEIDELPADEDVDGRQAPEGYGQTFTRFQRDIGEGDLLVDFEGDDDVDWLVELVEVSNDEVLRVAEAEVVDGVGSVTLSDFGGHDVVMVISPLVNSENSYDYAWSAQLVEPPVDEVDEEETGGPKGEETAACGCSSNGPGVAGLGMLLGLAASLRRRRPLGRLE